MMLKRSTKAIGNLLLDHQTLTCRPNNIHTTFIAPVEYEFSCSNTPLFYHRRSKHNKRHGRELTVNKVRKVFDILNSYDEEITGTETETGKSPLTLLGFGKSPNVPRLRVTDSPFPVNDTEEDTIQVDKAAEEFIKNFYMELRRQKNRAAVEPPSPWKWAQVR
ncbi:uncharacterized protein LOC143578218 [Bidens hawaiensis]|uniref:uncharacterized protein LOC143578218 n=1 Tax=Bidens hawaiensis TaxID=980011 RepID=UPI00404B6563